MLKMVHNLSTLFRHFLRQMLIIFLLVIYPIMLLIMWLVEKKTGEKI